MIFNFIEKQARQGTAAYTPAALRHAVMLCLVVGGLLGLMGCGYAGQPPASATGSGSHADLSASNLQATPSSIAFGNVVSGQPYSQTVRLSNSGTTDLTITQVKASGAGFSTSGLSLPLTLASGQSASFSAAFVSTTSDTATGAISVASDAPGFGPPIPVTIGMSATVVPATVQLTPSVSPVNFGNGTVGVAEAQNVTLTNTGNSNVNISTVSVSGAGFGASGGSNVTLAPNQTVNVIITFDAAGTGPAAGTLMVASNGAALQIGLTGTGVNTGQHSVSLSWNPSTSAVAGYYVYRGDGLTGALSRLIASTISTTIFTDSTVVSGQAYNYAVTSVDQNSVESTYSNQVSLTIPSP